MNSSEYEDMNEGTVAGVLEFPWPWPPRTSVVLLRYAMEAGFAEIQATRYGSLMIRIESNDGAILFEAATCCIQMTMGTKAVFITPWSLPDEWDFHVMCDVIGSLDPSIDVPKIYHLSNETAAPIPTDFSVENRSVVDRRKDTYAGSQATRKKFSNKVAKPKCAARKELLEEVYQIRGLLSLMKNGHSAYAKSLAVRLRMMIATGRPLPLLQLNAAATGRSLVAYTNAQTDISDIQRVAQRYGDNGYYHTSSIRPERSPDFPSAVDIDVWLDLPWGYWGNKIISNQQILKMIGDAKAHYDLDVPRVVDMMETSTTDLGRPSGSFLIQYLVDVAETVLRLAEREAEKS